MHYLCNVITNRCSKFPRKAESFVVQNFLQMKDFEHIQHLSVSSSKSDHRMAKKKNETEDIFCCTKLLRRKSTQLSDQQIIAEQSFFSPQGKTDCLRLQIHLVTLWRKFFYIPKRKTVKKLQEHAHLQTSLGAIRHQYAHVRRIGAGSHKLIHVFVMQIPYLLDKIAGENNALKMHVLCNLLIHLQHITSFCSRFQKGN